MLHSVSIKIVFLFFFTLGIKIVFIRDGVAEGHVPLV